MKGGVDATCMAYNINTRGITKNHKNFRYLVLDNIWYFLSIILRF